MKSRASHVIFSLGLVHFHIKEAIGCVILDYSSTQTNLTVSSVWDIYKGPISMAASEDNAGILDYVGPKQVRAWLAVMSASYTASAYYHESALNFFALEADEDYRRCMPTSDSEQLFFDNEARLVFAYTYLWSIQSHIPEWSNIASNYATQIGIDLSVCSTSTCDLDTPTGLAKTIVEENDKVFAQDGWNADGSYTKDINRVEFEEWRDPNSIFHPNQLCVANWKVKQEACSITSIDYSDPVCWKPQVHQIGNYLYEDTYLMQHVASSGRSYFLGDEAICDLKLDYPCLDLGFETNEAIRRLRVINDEGKAQVELFDNIWSWFNIFLTDYYDDNNLNASEWDIVKAITTNIAAMYEVTLVVWKEKINNGIVRPRTLVNKRMQDTEITSYLGPDEQSVGSIKGNEWVPYSSKHAQAAEYPSHTSCMCSVLASGMALVTGAQTLGNNGITVTRLANSSTIETNKPENDVDFEFSKWSDLAVDCHEAMLNSGTAMSVSRDAANDFCAPITSKIVDAFDALEAGQQPKYIIATDNLEMVEDRCKELEIFWCDRIKAPTLKFLQDVIDFLGITVTVSP